MPLRTRPDRPTVTRGRLPLPQATARVGGGTGRAAGARPQRSSGGRSPRYSFCLIAIARLRSCGPRAALLLIVHTGSDRTVEPVRQDSSFAEKQESHPALLLVVQFSSERPPRRGTIDCRLRPGAAISAALAATRLAHESAVTRARALVPSRSVDGGVDVSPIPLQRSFSVPREDRADRRRMRGVCGLEARSVGRSLHS
jgi:hypothetical protein